MCQVSVFINKDIDRLADFIIKFTDLGMQEFSSGNGSSVIFIMMLNLFLGDFIGQEVKVLKKEDASLADDLCFYLFSKAW